MRENTLAAVIMAALGFTVTLTTFFEAKADIDFVLGFGMSLVFYFISTLILRNEQI